MADNTKRMTIDEQYDDNTHDHGGIVEFTGEVARVNVTFAVDVELWEGASHSEVIDLAREHVGAEVDDNTAYVTFGASALTGRLAEPTDATVKAVRVDEDTDEGAGA